MARVAAALLLTCSACSADAAGTADAGDAALDAGATSLAYERIEWAGATVQNFDAALLWYRDALGLPLSASGGTGKRWAWFTLSDASLLELFSGGSAAAQPKSASQQSAVLGLEVADLDRALSELAQRGVHPITATIATADGRFAEFADPEGNRHALQQLGPATSAPGFLRFSSLRVSVADADGMAAWYRGVLGLAPPPTTAPERSFQLADGARLELVPDGVVSSTPKAPDAQPVVAGLVVKDLDGTVAELTTRGVRFSGGVQSGDGERWIYFSDPEGNRLEIKQLP